jgi:hypothetical protein
VGCRPQQQELAPATADAGIVSSNDAVPAPPPRLNGGDAGRIEPAEVPAELPAVPPTETPDELPAEVPDELPAEPPIEPPAETPIEPPPGFAGERLQPEDFAYAGAFRLPDEFAWGARGMTYSPGGNNGAGTLLITGFELPRNQDGSECSGSADCYAYYGEVEIPAPALVATHSAAPQARLLGPMRRFDNGLVARPDYTTTWVSDVTLVPPGDGQEQPTLYGARTMWYAEGVFGEGTFPTIWTANLDGSGARGLFHIGPHRPPFHGRKMGDYLFTVPRWYADRYLGGHILVTGRSRGTPAGDWPMAGGSQGPTLFAFDVAGPHEDGGDLDAVPMLYYRTFFPECAGDNVGSPENCDYPNFTMCDNWTGADFVDVGHRRAILLLGYKGLGRNCYDHPPIDCEDPCGDDHGYHCAPYERQVIFYDVDELGRSALGEGNPWEVLPYRVWRPQEFFLRGHTCGDAGGLAFDTQGQRLFLVERGLGGGGANQAAVHVWTSHSLSL